MPTEPAGTAARAKPSGQLLAAALEQFATIGFAGTSLQQIADSAGYSKSSVLYHFASKEAVLEAALTPAIDELERILDEWMAEQPSDAARAHFLTAFVEMLLAYRLEVHTFINQGQSLHEMPVIARANSLIVRLAGVVCPPDASTEAKLRFGMALGGAAFTLTAGPMFAGETLAPDDELRPVLVGLISELLAPVPLTSSTR